MHMRADNVSEKSVELLHHEERMAEVTLLNQIEADSQTS